MEIREIVDDNTDGWHDPLAVKVGLGMEVAGEGIPSEGWPEEPELEIIARALSYLPE